MEREREGAAASSSGKGATRDPSDVPEGETASNVVALRHGSTDDSLDESQLLEECYPDTPEPARGKNKRSKE
jgi:hypothetical protein